MVTFLIVLASLAVGFFVRPVYDRAYAAFNAKIAEDENVHPGA